MQQAIMLAGHPDFDGQGNPRVGCVVLAADGEIVGTGHHRGAGHPHAEVVALQEAGDRAVGGTVVVTLEPCRHTGRTPPCTDALIEADVAAVVFAVTDPGDHSGAGAEVLRAAGIDVEAGRCANDASALIADWLHVQRTGRPWVIVKCAMTLDGRVADRDGQPLAITSPHTNAQSHRLRSNVDAIIVGTGTVLADDPALTARAPDGSMLDSQPLRIVVGERSIPESAKVRGAGFRHIASKDLRVIARELLALGCERVLVEGGPTLQRALLAEGYVDELRWSVSPILIGAGPTAAGVALHPVQVDVEQVDVVGEDVVVIARISR